MSMEKAEREYIKLKLATCFRKILKKNKSIGEDNKIKGIEDLTLVDTMRQLESASGLSYTIIQTTSVGKRDIQFASLITLIDSLNITFTDFASIYDKITEKEIEETKSEIETGKKVAKDRKGINKKKGLSSRKKEKK